MIKSFQSEEAAELSLGGKLGKRNIKETSQMHPLGW